MNSPKASFQIPYASQGMCVTDLPMTPPTGFDQHFQPLAHLTFCVPPSLKQVGTGILTCPPSTTPFGLALGPDLPWADEPSPGILRFSAGRILTCLFAYLYLHSHFSTLQHSFRYTFSVLRTLLYQYILRHIPQLR